MKNWGGNIDYRASVIHQPTSLDELRTIITSTQVKPTRASSPAQAESTPHAVRVVGSRHSFNRLSDGDALIDLSGMPPDITIAGDRSSVRVAGHVRYGELAVALHTNGLALHNLASLPHISVAGAVATATHGSGVSNGNLATAVQAIEVLRADGEVVRVSGPELDELVIHLGALGVVVTLELAVEPTYALHQTVFEGLTWDRLIDDLRPIMLSGRSVSVFTRWGATAGQVWRKALLTNPSTRIPGTTAAVAGHHPIGHDAESCTEQLGIPGPWHERLPHFRAEFEPSSGDEIQSEWHVSSDDAAAAIDAMRSIGEHLSPVLLVGEIRMVAADSLMLSPQFEQETVSLHFTWRNDAEAAMQAVELVEDALAPFNPRAHLGKLFSPGATGLSGERRRAFVAHCRAWDPSQRFWNEWLETNLV